MSIGDDAYIFWFGMDQLECTKKKSKNDVREREDRIKQKESANRSLSIPVFCTNT